MKAVVEGLRSLSAAGTLGLSVAELAASYAHMHVNRMIRFAANNHELVIYDFLARLYEAQIARSKRATAAAVATPGS